MEEEPSQMEVPSPMSSPAITPPSSPLNSDQDDDFDQKKYQDDDNDNYDDDQHCSDDLLQHNFENPRLNDNRTIVQDEEVSPIFPNAKLLEKNEKTYKYNSNLFLSNISKVDPNAIVTNIQEFQISEPHGRARWNAFEKQIEMTEALRGKANVVYAWYAAPAEKVASIFSLGFELLYAHPLRKKPSFGAGIFLADLGSPQYSGMQYTVDEDPEKYLILCRVVLGSVEQVDIEFHQTCASRDDFDTGSDNPKHPKWYVVWAYDINTRILPVCVFTCKASGINATVDWNMYAYEKFAFPKLMLEMKKRFPIHNVPALHDIYDSLKKQKVTIEMFQDQIWTLVGEDILLQIAKDNLET